MTDKPQKFDVKELLEKVNQVAVEVKSKNQKFYTLFEDIDNTISALCVVLGANKMLDPDTRIELIKSLYFIEHHRKAMVIELLEYNDQMEKPTT